MNPLQQPAHADRTITSHAQNRPDSRYNCGMRSQTAVSRLFLSCVALCVTLSYVTLSTLPLDVVFSFGYYPTRITTEATTTEYADGFLATDAATRTAKRESSASTPETKSKKRRKLFLSSQLEATTKWTKLIIPIRGVCHTQGNLHFFQDPLDETLSGVEAFQFFKKNHKPPGIFYDWDKPRGSFDPVPILHNTSMDEWMDKTSVDRRIGLYYGSSFVVPPHLPNNQFHLFNDLIVPLFRDALKSQTVEAADSTQDGNKPKNKYYRNLFLLKGNGYFVKHNVIMFDVLFKLFHRVHYPFEDFIRDQRKNSMTPGGAVCFERYIWSQETKRPFYTHAGRFDDDNDKQWKGVVPAMRDTINKAYEIDVPPRSQFMRRLRQNHNKPKLIWASRTVGQDPEKCERCIVNEHELLESLHEKFDVELLPISDRKLSRETNLMGALKQMATADMLGGLHGAGLGHALFLQPGAVLFEMKDRSHWVTNLFLNMANLNEVGYYAYDTRSLELPGERERFFLDEAAIKAIKDGLWQAWQAEVKERLKKETLEGSGGEVEDEGTCQFPIDDLAGKVSAFNTSRCYLVMGRHGMWKQASDYNEDKHKNKKKKKK